MFRDELDALNAIYKEQQLTNELLKKLIGGNTDATEPQQTTGLHSGNSRSRSNKPAREKGA
ncbi:hypothetical protein [Paenibacillus pabuli]|uniref:hypothetical protein n=1 Tax=Paenibacillus pabuli TaxID=1472 RepID=UPI001FFEB3E2|nr:hypothetical protein [Paenibacillus pabuli]UPK42468.1 hypothetical protein KET34_25255 [Paenibacillus pabuli]